MKEETTLVEEKLGMKDDLEHGKELANRLMKDLKNPFSSKESNKSLISGILRSYENAIVMLGLDQQTLKRRSPERMDQRYKKRKNGPRKLTYVLEQDKKELQLDDGYCWRKYGQKDIHGSENPRGYYRCTHRFTRGCLAVKQVQKSDADPSCYEVKYLKSHTCNVNLSTTKSSVVSVPKEEPNNVHELHVAEQSVDIIKHMKFEETMLSLDDLENKNEIFRTFSFSNLETENITGRRNLMENLSPTTTSESGITNELLSASSASVVNSPADDSCFTSLENILDLSYDDWSLI
ncbi:hypothetical protein CARUB_v10019489mg [Capsella rubella]|uniref:WRKY domain-containing protein n=1 Tax=Capsella rubella TaxID=81985 RepID=R0FTA9_9BRAS|nr:hypothetical protein CARUB_v10019489mg [Capsella rubella]